MLDRSKIIKELASRVDGLESVLALELNLARTLWERVAHDAQLCERLWTMPHQFILPSWTGALGEKKTLHPLAEYDIVAIDGSQIYPDRHQGIDCFLINIGAIHFKYRAHKSSVTFQSEPTVHFTHETPLCDDSPEGINAMRTEFEFKKGTEWFKKSNQDQVENFPRILLFDGSLIFWHLHAPESSQKSVFLDRYLVLLEELFEQKILYACYISLPKSRELINVLRATAKLSKETVDFNYFVDIDIADLYLAPGERSTVLCNHAPVTQRYPEHSKPHFFYVNTGYEMGRVEIPARIAQDPEKLAVIESIIYDQLIKGFGYPIALAESHEQAVITNTDREFFYQTLRSMTIHSKICFRQSQKLMKKQRAGI